LAAFFTAHGADGCIVWNAHNTVFSSKHSATCGNC